MISGHKSDFVVAPQRSCLPFPLRALLPPCRAAGSPSKPPPSRRPGQYREAPTPPTDPPTPAPAHSLQTPCLRRVEIFQGGIPKKVHAHREMASRSTSSSSFMLRVWMRSTSRRPTCEQHERAEAGGTHAQEDQHAGQGSARRDARASLEVRGQRYADAVGCRRRRGGGGKPEGQI